MLHNAFSTVLYEAIWSLANALARTYAGVSASFQAKLREREAALEDLKDWPRIRSRFPKCAVFVCSSAGEYEQAKPLLRRLSDRKDTALFVLFFSPSGIRFARSQKEDIPFTLVASDRPSYWRAFCTDLRPDLFLCVRYELWPGMISVCRRYAPLYLIDGVEAGHLRVNRISRKLRSALVSGIKKVFVVSEGDRNFYRDVLSYPLESIEVTGDTKYDRVLERILEREDKMMRLKTELSPFLKGRKVIVIGSAWPRDMEEFMSVYPELKKHTPNLSVIVAPHDLSAINIALMEKSLEGANLCRVSSEGYGAVKEETDILLVDILGDLPELYGCADLAWVGGALHYRVHNVLEPACRGLYLCFGPLYETSQEAKVLVSEGLAKVIQGGPDFLKWYKTLLFDARPPHKDMEEAVLRNKGASDRIMKAITTSWRT